MSRLISGQTMASSLAFSRLSLNTIAPSACPTPQPAPQRIVIRPVQDMNRETG